MEDKLSPFYSNAANHLSMLFKESVDEIQNAKNIGKKDKYQECLKWMIDSNNGDLKFVRIEDFLHMLRGESGETDGSRSSLNYLKKYKAVGPY